MAIGDRLFSSEQHGDCVIDYLELNSMAMEIDYLELNTWRLR